MWYQKDAKKTLDYSKPIMACECFLLLPSLEKGSYDVIGYNWFNLATGLFNSCSNFKTPEEAVNSYTHRGVRNVSITVEDI